MVKKVKCSNKDDFVTRGFLFDFFFHNFIGLVCIVFACVITYNVYDLSVTSFLEFFGLFFAALLILLLFGYGIVNIFFAWNRLLD